MIQAIARFYSIYEGRKLVENIDRKGAHFFTFTFRLLNSLATSDILASMQVLSVKALRRLTEKDVKISSYPQDSGKLCDGGQAFKLLVVWRTIYVKLY